VHVDEKKSPVAERANDVAFFRHQGSANKNRAESKSNNLPEAQMESSKSTRIPARAKQDWNEIPENLKTVRNGKKYVLAEFGGKGYLTEWVGGVQTSAEKSNKVVTSITPGDAAKMSAAKRDAILKDPRSPASVKRIVRKYARGGRS
jgi:hypothetical protein